MTTDPTPPDTRAGGGQQEAGDLAPGAPPLALRTGPLVGRIVRLEPLGPHHAAGLAAAAAEDRSTYDWTLVPDGPDESRSYVADLLAAAMTGEVVPFAQVSAADGRVVGATRFMALRHHPGQALPFAVEIGGTWLAASAQRTGTNIEAKLLLMTHAFEAWNVGRVDLKTDSRNKRSRNAIGALGATFEGVLRNWQLSYGPGEAGRLRDTAIFSVTDGEWPEVKEGLISRLNRHSV